jgi:hypothetical protein
MTLKLLKSFLDKEKNIRFLTMLYEPKDQPVQLQYLIKETVQGFEGLTVSYSYPIRLINTEETIKIKKSFNKIRMELLYNDELEEVLNQEGIELFEYKWKLNFAIAQRNIERGIC